MSFSFFDKPSEDVVLELESGGKVFFSKDPRYGMWKISYGKGEPPERLRGKYMSYQDALRDFEGYLKTRRRGKKWAERQE